jgi:hypothetical protein
MSLPKVFERFARQSPVTVMMRGLLEYTLPPSRLDELFREHAVEQYEDELLFSTVVDLFSLVVCGARKSVNDAYKLRVDELTVSVTSVYNKLKGTEAQVSQALVRDSASRLEPLVIGLKSECPPLLPGYSSRILDGNHLAATQHRLPETWLIGSAPLPGLCLAVLDAERRLMRDVFPCEDGHAQERTLLGEVLETAGTKDLWIADRNFCVTDFLLGLHRRGASFIIREHANGLRNKQLIGRRRKVGECDTGTVYEQRIRIGDPGQEVELRRITIVLHKSTRDGATELHIVTNVPQKDADAVTIANVYRKRWTVETGFQELGQALNGEINTLCYPRASLLAFCIALYLYNILSVLKAAMRSVHKEEAAIDTISGYYLSSEISSTYLGMMIAIERHQWTKAFAALTKTEMVSTLRSLAKHVRLIQFRKNVRGPKKPAPKRTNAKYAPHVSTKRLLDQRIGGKQ